VEQKSDLTVRLIHLPARQDSQLVAFQGLPRSSATMAWRQAVTSDVDFRADANDPKHLWWESSIETDAGRKTTQYLLIFREACDASQCLNAIESTKKLTPESQVDEEIDQQVLDTLRRVDGWKWHGCTCIVFLAVEDEAQAMLKLLHLPGRRSSQLVAFRGKSGKEMWKLELTTDLDFRIEKHRFQAESSSDGDEKIVTWDIHTESKQGPGIAYFVTFDATKSAQDFLSAMKEAQGGEEAAEGDSDKTQAAARRLSSITEDLQCSICTDLMTLPTILCCGHSFCERCVTRLRAGVNLCAICRKTIASTKRNITLEKVVANIVPDKEEEHVQQASAPAPAPASGRSSFTNDAPSPVRRGRRPRCWGTHGGGLMGEYSAFATGFHQVHGIGGPGGPIMGPPYRGPYDGYGGGFGGGYRGRGRGRF